MNLSKNHQIPLSKIYICLCQKKHIYPYQKFAFTFIFFLHFILTGTELKRAKTKNLEKEAEKALEQIEEKKYDTLLINEGIKEIIKIGLVFDGKKAVAYY